MSQVTAETLFPQASVLTAPPVRKRRIRGGIQFIGYWLLVVPARLASLVVLLAICSAIPFVQLIVLGYLLDVSGRLARGEPWRMAFPNLMQAGRIGLAMLVATLVALPVWLISYWAYAAELIEFGSWRATGLRIGGFALVIIGYIYLVWAWLRGGRLRDYAWPQPVRFVKTIWRRSTWQQANLNLSQFISSLELPRLWWLGLRGAVGTLIWISLPALLLVGATRNGETGLAGLVGTLGIFGMGFVVAYLPLLQVNFAAENRLRAMFAWRQVRSVFRSAPIACWFAVAATLLLAIPLYLLKIEATPKEIVWAPAIVFIAFMLPARIIAGWSLRRGLHREPGKRWWNTLARFTFRLLTIPVVFFYLFFVYVSQLTSWDGLATWFQQHAFLIPVPFVGV
jgi:hypothetical protein